MIAISYHKFIRRNINGKKHWKKVRRSLKEILMSMAHEFGHYLSHKKGWAKGLGVDYRSNKITLKVYNEEVKAWNNAEKIMIKFGDINMRSFNGTKNIYLKRYFYYLSSADKKKVEGK